MATSPESTPNAAAPEGVPPAELDVLAFLLRRGDSTARAIREGLAERRPMAQGSALTLLERLRGKGLVARRKSGQGKAFLYRATRRPAPIYRRLVGDLLERVFAGNSMALVASLFESQAPTAKQLDELQSMLDHWRAADPAVPATEDHE